MKIKKSKVKIFCIVLAGMIVVAALFFYMALFKGFYASSDKPIGDYSGPADFDFLGRKEIYHVVANKYGEPIFENSSGAFDEAEADYGDAIQLIYDTFGNEYDLGPFNEKNYQMYMTLGWQLPTDDEIVRKQGSDLSTFLDIYENSEKRWFLTPIGWVSEAP